MRWIRCELSSVREGGFWVFGSSFWVMVILFILIACLEMIKSFFCRYWFNGFVSGLFSDFIVVLV